MDNFVDQHGLGILGENDFRQYRLMQGFAHQVSDILATVADVLQPPTFDALEQHWLGDLRAPGAIDDLELRRYLEQQGAVALPEVTYPLAPGEFEGGARR